MQTRYTHVTASVVVLPNGPGILAGVVVGTAAAGQTLKLHDCAEIGDAAAGNLISTIDLDELGDYRFGCRVENGLVAVVSGGTPDATVLVA